MAVNVNHRSQNYHAHVLGLARFFGKLRLGSVDGARRSCASAPNTVSPAAVVAARSRTITCARAAAHPSAFTSSDAGPHAHPAGNPRHIRKLVTTPSPMKASIAACSVSDATKFARRTG